MKYILNPLSIELKGNISYKKVKEALKSSVNILYGQRQSHRSSLLFMQQNDLHVNFV